MPCRCLCRKLPRPRVSRLLAFFRAADHQRAARRRLRGSQPVAVARQGDPVGSAGEWLPGPSSVLPSGTRRGSASGRRWCCWSASPGWSWCTSNATVRRSWRPCRLGYFVVMLAGMLAFGDGGVGHERGRLRGLLQPALTDVAADGRRRTTTCTARRPLSGLTGMPVRSGTVAAGVRGDRHDHLRRLLQRRRVAQARAPPAERLLRGSACIPRRRSSSPTQPGCCCASSSSGWHLRARHQGRADRQPPLHQGRAEPCLRPHDRPDRVRLRAGPLLLAADLAGPGDRSRWPRTRSATAPTSSGPPPNGSTTRSSPSPRSGTCRSTALVAGHVGGLTLAHDPRLTMYRDSQEAVRSQYWMLTVMVAFTSFGLWLLSAVGT